MVRIARHSISNPVLSQERFDRAFGEIAWLSDHCSKEGTHFDVLMGPALMGARDGSTIAGKSADVGKAIRIAADAAACIFAAVSTNRVPLSLDGKPIPKVEQSDQSTMNTSRWLSAFFLNCLCRNLDNLNLLCSVPLCVLQESSTKEPQYRDLFATAIHRYWNNEDGIPKLLIEAMEKTDPDRYELVSPEWTLHLDVPQIKLFMQAVSHDAHFGKTVELALNLHKAYWSKNAKDEYDRPMDPDGFLAINLLGLAAMAYDRDLSVDIDSEYLPMYLVDGSFLRSA